MALPFYRLTSARLRFLVFLLLAVAVIAAQAQPKTHSEARAPAAEQQLAPLRGPLFGYVVDAGCRLGELSRTLLGGHAGS